jgi:16S rRNA (guanine527-N7)-methyltransferase
MKNKCYFDIDALYTKHILHSLGIAKVIDFVPGTYVSRRRDRWWASRNSISDSVSENAFHLIDITAKKIKVVQAVVDVLELKNVKTEQLRAELVRVILIL